MLDVTMLEAKNFLSYGNKWTKIELKEGINLITGLDKDKNRSNGAGKTSFMEILIFSLFGQVSKGLKQTQIINWKNKKNCETITTFNKNDHTYKFHRGLKPNFLKVSKDGSEYPINSSIKDFQKEIEEQIIGMDFKTFNNLIYLNPNNSVSLVDSPKAQKRLFIEKQFNLTEFSALNKMNNENIKKLNDTLSDIKNNIIKNDTLSDENINEKNDIQNETNNIDLSIFENKIKTIELDISSLKDDRNINDFKDLVKNNKNKLEVLLTKQTELISKKNTVKNELIEILSTLKALKKQKDDIGDVSISLSEIDKINKKLLFFVDTEDIIKAKKDSLIEIKEQIESYQKNKLEHYSTITTYKKQIESFNLNNIKDKVKCPTCHQKIDYESIKKEIDDEIDNFNTKIIDEQSKMQIFIDGIDSLNESIKKHNKDIENLEKNLKQKIELEKRLIVLNTYKEKQNNLEKIDIEIKKLSNFTDKKKQIDDYVIKINEIDKDILQLKENIKINENIIEVLHKNEADLIIKQKELYLIKNDLEHKTLLIKENNDKISKKELKIKELASKLEKLNNKEIQIQNKKDHLNFIKDILKDENIKQYSINNLIPLIESHANKYLSEAGFNFYLKIDNWLDIEIKGPGIGDCSFASMSGGERKSIDLSMKFAIMDISISRNPNFPNILILDELMDSSVDSYGIKELINIIEIKQKDKNLKIFIISHRSEMDSLNQDNTYIVEKVNGFSSIIQTLKEI